MRTNPAPQRWFPLAALLLVLPLPAAAADDIEPLLKAQTVTIQVEREGKSPEIGSGVVICQTPDEAYILTARHVLFGKSLPNRRAPGLAGVTRIEISFQRNLLLPPVAEAVDRQEEVITKQEAGKEKDLLLLTVPVQGTLRTAALGAAPAGTELSAGGEPTVYAIGYRQGSQDREAEPWAFSQGKLVQRDADFLHHSAPITSGFSGGPLFNESGALIGINLRVESGLEIGADPEVEYGRAILIEEVIRTIDRWLPAACLQSAEPLRELAYATYRRAMRATSIKDWPEAERLMRETLKHLPWEGGSVHLQGMRYTTYLPHYHLGLALYKNGKCGEALREWGRSEVQQTIRNDKRYRIMKRYRSRCERLLEQQLRTSSRATEGE